MWMTSRFQERRKERKRGKEGKRGGINYLNSDGRESEGAVARRRAGAHSWISGIFIP